MKINIEKIEKERIRQGLSKPKLAKKMGMTRQAYYDFLKNKSTKWETLDKIATILEFDPKDLLI